MTIETVHPGDVVLFAIPATRERGMAAQEPPAALSEGVAASIGAENRHLVRRPEDLAMAAVAPIGEIARTAELLTGRDRLSPPGLAAARTPSAVAGAWRVGSGLFGH